MRGHAQTQGRDGIHRGDLEEIGAGTRVRNAAAAASYALLPDHAAGLFLDAKASAKLLTEQADKYISN